VGLWVNVMDVVTPSASHMVVPPAIRTSTVGTKSKDSSAATRSDANASWLINGVCSPRRESFTPPEQVLGHVHSISCTSFTCASPLPSASVVASTAAPPSLGVLCKHDKV